MENKKLWFKRKWYGWGWYPVTWQGYVLSLVYTAAVVAFALTLDNNSPAREIFFTFILPVTLLTIVFIRICYKKGESPRWQWGRPEEETSLTSPTSSNSAGKWVLSLVVILVLLFVLNVWATSSKIPQNPRDGSIKSGLSIMRLWAEEYFTQNGESFSVANNCSEGMFANDSTMSGIIESIKRNGGDAQCRATETAWAASSLLPETGTTQCVDSEDYDDLGVVASSGPAICIKSI